LNGIPIIDYQGELVDNVLEDLKNYLIERILPAKDVREVIEEDFFSINN
jgi:hypothetical protein